MNKIKKRKPIFHKCQYNNVRIGASGLCWSGYSGTCQPAMNRLSTHKNKTHNLWYPKNVVGDVLPYIDRKMDGPLAESIPWYDLDMMEYLVLDRVAIGEETRSEYWTVVGDGSFSCVCPHPWKSLRNHVPNSTCLELSSTCFLIWN